VEYIFIYGESIELKGNCIILIGHSMVLLITKENIYFMIIHILRELFARDLANLKKEIEAVFLNRLFR